MKSPELKYSQQLVLFPDRAFAKLFRHSIECLEARIAPATIYAVDSSNHLLSFDSATPGTVVSESITGLSVPATETIRGIDFRPANGKLYALGINDADNGGGNADEGRLYTIDVDTGALALVGSGPVYTNFADKGDYGFDVDPVGGLIHITTAHQENVEVDPNNGSFFADTGLTESGATPQVVGDAYDHNFDGTKATTLYGIDNANDSLVRIGGENRNPSPSGGVVTPIGPLGVAFTDNNVGFDIESRTGIAYAVLRSTGGATSLYTLNLTSGAATLVGAVGGDPSLHGMAVALTDDLTVVSPTVATFLDEDGDKVTIKITGTAPGAALSKDDFTFSTREFGSQLKLLDFSDDGQEWKNASISIQAVPVTTAGVTRGDSFVDIGYLNARGVDLAKVTINGDLGQIDTGDATTTTPGLASLTVHSLGTVFDSQLNPRVAVPPDQVSDIVGKLGVLTVQRDFNAEQINVTGGVDGSIGSIFIGGDLAGSGPVPNSGIKTSGAIGNITIAGSLFGSSNQLGKIFSGGSIGDVKIGGSIFGGLTQAGSILSSGTMGNVTVGGTIFGGVGDTSGTIKSMSDMGNIIIEGSLIGGSAPNAGSIESGGKIGTVLIKGNLRGGSGSHAGEISAQGDMGTVTIAGSVTGGSASNSGNIESGGVLGKVLIKGSLVGGTADHSGDVHAQGGMGNVTILGSIIGGMTNGANDDDSGTVYTGSGGSIGALKIGGDLQGGNRGHSGSVYSGGSILSATVGGSLVGGDGTESGSLEASTGIGNVGIGASVRGGLGFASGSIYTFGHGNIGSVTVKGALAATSSAITGILSGGTLGAVKVADVRAERGLTLNLRISAEGIADPVTPALAVAIKSINVKGSIANAIILAGYSTDGNATNPDVSVGAVTVGGNWIASSLIVGAATGADNLFGTTDDVKISEPAPDEIVSKIASVTIKGFVSGTPRTVRNGDRFGIVAEQIGTVKVGLRSYILAPGTDTTGFALGTTGDFLLREV